MPNYQTSEPIGYSFYKGKWLMVMGLVLVGLIVFGGGYLAWRRLVGWDKQRVISPEAPWVVIEKPLEKYSFPELRKRQYIGSEIKIDAKIFIYEVEGKKISGQIHLPTGSDPVGGWPVVIMIRGYVDREIYQTGIGTQHAAEYLAKNGFMTLAPDFLGFGESDMPPDNVLAERFLRPVQILELIASVKNIPKANPAKINIWGHSNGGQIALSVLEISGKKYPTSLWAPVSKPFPYSILYYTDESDDRGKALRRAIAGFDVQYEASEFSIDNYYNWIEAPVQIHQGTVDEAVPLKWSQELESKLRKLGKEVELNIYPGADHNLSGGENSWNSAVQRNVLWFNRQ
ncbi:MAG: alpha/beta fold hydrolase [Patescibacteria group bacterium]|nr:alpha/beta fold hydrolase [Patescibacteria group bacterium]